MIKKMIVLVALLGLPILCGAQVKAYPIDSWHSDVSFKVKFGGLLPVRGSFDRFSGTILLYEQDLLKTSATVVIDASSVNTGLEMRDNHLRDEDFF